MAELAFGCMRLPITDPDNTASVDETQTQEMFDLFLERGFTYFDTAYVYHSNESENIVRRCLVERHPRDSFTVATKLPTWAVSDSISQQAVFEEQLAKVGVDFFDYYLIHNINSNSYKKVQELDSFAFIEQQKAAGHINHTGFSFHDGPELLEEVLSAHPEVEFVQLQINYLDWEDPTIRARRNYEVATSHGKWVSVMEPIRGGTLANLPEKAAKLLSDYNPGLSQASWALRFAASLPEVHFVLSGMSNLEQTEQNTQLFSALQPLDEDERQLLSRVAMLVRSDKAVPCTSCRYCVSGCPQHIAIPDYFTLYNTHQRDPKLFQPSMYYRNYTARYGKASDCIDCRRCVRACPQGIQIPEMLKEVAAAFESKE